MNRTPKVSVLMPAYNAMRYVGEAVASILSQTFTDFEFVIIDDGSTDETRTIIEQFARKDRRIRLVSRENRGIVATLNEGLSLCRAPYIARMDADDVALPDRFKRQVEFLDAKPDYVVIGCQLALIDPKGRYLGRIPLPLDHEEIDTGNMAGHSGLPHPGVMMRRAVVSALGGYNSSYPYAQDIDLWLRVAEIGRLANLPEVCLHYRLHLSSIGVSQRPTQERLHWMAARDAAARRQLPFDRPPPTSQPRQHLGDLYECWAWWALAAGEKSTARLYSAKALLTSPVRLSRWKTMACTIRGH